MQYIKLSEGNEHAFVLICFLQSYAIKKCTLNEISEAHIYDLLLQNVHVFDFFIIDKLP